MQSETIAVCLLACGCAEFTAHVEVAATDKDYWDLAPSRGMYPVQVDSTARHLTSHTHRGADLSFRMTADYGLLCALAAVGVDAPLPMHRAERRFQSTQRVASSCCRNKILYGNCTFSRFSSLLSTHRCEYRSESTMKLPSPGFTEVLLFSLSTESDWTSDQIRSEL